MRSTSNIRTQAVQVAREEAKRSPASRKSSKREGEERTPHLRMVVPLVGREQTHSRIAAAEDVEEEEEEEEEEGIESDLLVKI